MEQSPLQPTPVGAFRFNTDSSKMEYYDGNQWVNITSDSPEAQTGGTRGVWMGGQTPSDVDTIDYANLSSTGNAIDFGNLTTGRGNNGDGGQASRTRGFIANGQSPIAGQIGYITFSSTGNETDFGDMAHAVTNGAGTASDSTRGLIFGGYASPATLNAIQYITMASSGNGVDFGDLADSGSSSAIASPTRAVTIDSSMNAVEYVTISTLGNAAEFGQAIQNGGHRGYASNAIRGVGFGGELAPSGSLTNTIEMITIATLGSNTEFGDQHATIAEGSACSSSIRAVYGGGNPSATNQMQYVQIMSVGNSVDFGDLTQGRAHCDACSNGHGGLG